MTEADEHCGQRIKAKAVGLAHLRKDFGRLEAVEKRGNRLVARIGSDYGGVTREREVDQVVVNHGTIPLDELYFDLKPASRNHGETSHDDLIAGRPQSVVRNLDGVFQLFRIGDAVAARNTHAAIYEALRLVREV